MNWKRWVAGLVGVGMVASMLVHSRALGGTVVFVAPRRVACDPRTSC